MNELKIGDEITIRYSKRLEQSGNSLLTNRTGVVTRVLTSGGNLTGAYVDVKVMRRIRNYYIPASSIEGSDIVNKTKTLSILKSIKL